MYCLHVLTLLHSERPKLCGVWAILSAIELKLVFSGLACDSVIMFVMLYMFTIYHITYIYGVMIAINKILIEFYYTYV